MNINELRVNNHVYLHGKIVTITSIGEGYLKYDNKRNAYYLDQFKPVYLTDEIIKDIDLELEFDDSLSNGNKYCLYYNGFFVKKVKYLHELENFYFAINNRELDLCTKK